MQIWLAAIWLEYGRAIAAEQRYWSLRQDPRCCISRHIFEEFYRSVRRP